MAELSFVRKRKTSGFMTVLSSAACEWLLIFLVFVDAVFSYLLKKFAHYCDLQTPCPLCSRLDHVFGKKKPGCYWSLVCSNHKEEISSLVSCSTHGKLADVHGMCEECLIPIAMENNSKSLKLLIGKMWVDVERSVLQNLMLNKHLTLGFPESRTCSCCNKTWRAKSNAERLLELNKVGLGASKANVKPPLPCVSSQSRLRCRDSLKRPRGKFTAPKRKQPTESNSVDTLSHVGYFKLKFSSGSDSEFPLSEEEEEDDGNASSSDDSYMKPEYDVGFGRKDIPRTPVNNAVLEKQTNQGSELKDQPDLLDLNELKNVCPSLTDSMNECLRELSVAESELLSLHTVPSSSNTLTIMEMPMDTEGTCENINSPTTVHAEAAAKTSDDTCSSNSNSRNLTGSLSQSTENIEISCEHEVEPINASDSARTEEDMKPTSQLSKSEVGLLLKDSSPGPHDEDNESRNVEDSSSQSLQLVASLKRNDSSYESLDGISVNDIEGESIVDRLRRQVEHDRSCMKSLYEDLEEERSAAAIAANEAMAMITRLQEEKAALKMEALQHLRMMEEQSEYDKKALEIANDLLSEREKELQDLEYELEFYRDNLPDESGLEDLRKESSVLENHAEAHSENTPCTSIDSESAEISEANDTGKPMSNSVSNFEDDKLYISQCLKKLEKKFYKAYCSGNVQEMPNGLNSYETKNEVGNLEDFPPNMDTLLDFDKNRSSASNGYPARHYASINTPADGEENDCQDEQSDNLPNSAAFEKEIAALHHRLEALETDQDLLKYASNLLRNGKDGLQLIQDLAHQLEELRKIEFRER